MDKFTFKIVDNQKLLEDVFAFRHTILEEVYPEYAQKYVQDGCDYDKYDTYAKHLVALNKEGAICATVRLIYNSPIGYPTQNSMKFDTTKFQNEKIGEISRIFIAKEYRNLRDTKIIIEGFKKILYAIMKELNITYTYGALEKKFLRLLKMYKMDYEVIGDVQEYKFVGMRYPVGLHTKQFGEVNNYETL